MQILAPSAFRGLTGSVVAHYTATENCMIEFPDGRGVAWIDDPCLEIIG